jgi:hypothetical protein
MTDYTYKFLPRYPDIDRQTELFRLYDGSFNEEIFRKKEFHEERLPENEPFPTNPGDLMKHQKLIARFMSSHTLYNGLLVVHEMGTGKTCSAVAAMEQCIAENNGITGALYIARGDTLVDNFVNELVQKCTDGRYIPRDEDGEVDEEASKRKLMREFYTTNTFETFAKQLSKLSPENIRQRYDNKIIVIDEIHNIRMPTAERKLNVYSEFHRFLHTVKNCKVLLLSGTPMKDATHEIADVMNLILPLDKQLPRGNAFSVSYFDNDGIIRPEKKDELKEVFAGRVSYLKSVSSGVIKHFMGTNFGGAVDYFKLMGSEMSSFQSRYYTAAYNVDNPTSGEGDSGPSGIYNNSRQATLFVFPDGTWGDVGFKKYVSKRVITKSAFGKRGGGTSDSFGLTKGLIETIRGVDDAETMQNLKRYSSLYAASVATILKAREEGKSVFVYNEFVQGSGLILFSLILEQFGFSKATGREAADSDTARYAILTSSTSSSADISKIVERFNQPDNMHGKVINVILGSKRIAEGLSFKNVQVEDIHTPWFNYTNIDQAIARGIRFGSHNMLMAKGITPVVDIYQRVAVPSDGTKSIDLQMYQWAEVKDVAIKQVERIIKESAWDCALNYNRNKRVGLDGERDCEYGDCEYVCDGVSTDLINDPQPELDESTYRLYYSNDNVTKIISIIQTLFGKVFSMTLLQITKILKSYSDLTILHALRFMIQTNTPITNKYGAKSYLRHTHNTFFLSEQLDMSSSCNMRYYTEYPELHSDQTYNQIIEKFYDSTQLKSIKKLCSTETQKSFERLVKRMPLETQEFILETAIRSKVKGLSVKKTIRSFILKYYQPFYEETPDGWKSTFLQKKRNIIRCLKDDEWKDCADIDTANVELDYSTKTIQELEQNEFGYYAQTNGSGTLCIRDVSSIIPDKKHKRTSGKVCTTWKKGELIDIVLDKLRIPIPTENVTQRDVKQLTKLGKMNIGDLRAAVSSNKYVKARNEDNPDLDADELRRILFWSSAQRDSLCGVYLRDWFHSKDLLVFDADCGKSSKLKI